MQARLYPDYQLIIALISTFPFLASLYSPSSKIGQNLPSILSTVYCLGQLFFLGTAQGAVGQVSVLLRAKYSCFTDYDLQNRFLILERITANIIVGPGINANSRHRPHPAYDGPSSSSYSLSSSRPSPFYLPSYLTYPTPHPQNT